MSDKQLVLDAVRDLPESATFDRISEEIAILAAIRRGEAASEQGKVVPHEQVRGLIAQWITESSGQSLRSNS